MYKAFYLAGVLALLMSTEVGAQTFYARQPRAVQAAKPTPVAKAQPAPTAPITEPEMTDEEAAAILNKEPAAMTPEQKIAAQAPVMKSNKIVAQAARPEQVRRMVDAMNTLQDVQVRRSNLNNGKEEKFTPEKIDATSSEAVEEYLNNKTIDNFAAAPLNSTETVAQ